MTVIKQYNPATSEWQTVMVGGTGPQGPPGEDGMEVGPNPPADTDILWADTGSTGVGSYITTFPFVDSADFGLVGDGVADDTAALQAFLNASPRRLHFLRGTNRPPEAWLGATGYRTTSTLTIPDFPGYQLTGEGRMHSVIEADFSNAPILRCYSENIHNYLIADLGLRFKTAQPAANTNAVGLYIDGPSAPSANGGCQMYYSTIRNLHFDNCCIGFDVSKPANRYNGVWNVVFDTLHFTHTSRNLIRLQSAGGQPINTFRMITSIGASGDGSPALEFQAVEFSIQGLDIEDWRGTILYASSGSGSIDGIHIERHVIQADYSTLFLLSDGGFTINNYAIDFAASAFVGTCIVQAVNQGNYTIGNGGINHSRLTGANSLALLRASGATTRINVPLSPMVSGNGTYYGNYYSWEETPQRLSTNTGQVPWDMPSVPVGGMVSKDITVDGARAGDAVAISMDFNISGGLQLTGTVSADNTVTATVVNHTTAVVDPGGAYLKARIWKAF